MPQELQAIILYISWFTLSIGIGLGVPIALVGGAYYKTAKRLPRELAFRYGMTISICAFIITIVLWLLAWIY
ncbi:hypothetical protein [Mammaliicoccus sciuri]|uniref:hypothetical protein n=1 Tax=Mammaliicoccus sciuri TaxID=1296 RepID=UPI001F2E6DC8|nr:hypothetical protein [Mammaliicoccus sciuri]MCE5086099.1 hypothetical protein [Mammaliicoccus sciuri]